MPLIDTHCHLNDSAAFPDLDSVIAQAQEAGVSKMIVIGIDRETSLQAIDLASQYECLFAVVGWHPNYTAKWSASEISVVRELMQHPKVVGLGEIGLDYHWTYATKAEQFAALSAQLDLAQELQCPTVFHCREAYSDLLSVLEEKDFRQPLFHCFAGSYDDAERAMALDAYFGIDGPITYKKADVLRSIVKGLPRDRLVIETDAPYLAPHPFRGKPNEPALLPIINNGLAATLEIEPIECAALTTANAQTFFRLV